jgi:hypothetical protein
MSLWRLLKGKLDEILWHDGLGDDLHGPKCAHCKSPATLMTGMFKCVECGQFLQCRDCCLAHHALTPLHVIKVSVFDLISRRKC